MSALIATNAFVMLARLKRRYSQLMLGCSAYRLFIVLLGLWVVLAPTFSAGVALAMTAPSSASDDITPNGRDCCPESEAERNLCKLMCLNASQMAVALEPGKYVPKTQVVHGSSYSHELPGIVLGPDPAPPKLSSLH